MHIYLVGGAVRDRLLNLPVIENDWVVVGSTPEEMLNLGYKPVGKDFPVFLHPETHEEYALARTERKSGRGYTGFTFHTSPDVTLEEDLRRRDLTINAMAMTKEGKVIDPYGGQDDLRARVLRHVSPAFVEDPVRILRVARFMARFHHLNFTVDENTKLLMKQMVEHGEVDALVADRVWREFDGALGEENPLMFFEVLDQCGALEKLFPEIKNHLAKIPRFADAKLPPFIKGAKETNSPPLQNGDKEAYKFSPPSLQKGVDAVRRRGDFLDNKIILFASLMLMLREEEIRSLCQRYPVPVDYKELALLANKQQHLFSKKELNAEEILDLLNMADAWRREKRFLNLLKVFPNSSHLSMVESAYNVAKQVSADKFMSQGLSGKTLGEAIQQERLRMIKSVKE